MTKKIIITTGGTGGHIYPALAVGKKLIDRGMDVLFVGSLSRMEKDIVPAEGFRFSGIDINPFQNFRKILSNINSFIQAFKIVKKEKAEIIIGFGNYISIPVLFAGLILGKKIYLQEQNVDLGMANRLFYKIAKKCFLAFDTTYEEISIKDQHKFLVTGNPLRDDIYAMNKEVERERLKIGKDEKVLLITGGSLGAKSLNEAVIKKLKDIYKDKTIRIYWATGDKNFNEINEKLVDQQIKMSDIIKPYFNNMINIMAAADLVVCRAGALTVSEIIQLEKPSILIPYNSIKVGQYQNAKIISDNEAALLYSDSKADEAIEKALELIKNDEELSKMSKKAKNLKKSNAAEKIVECLDIWRG
ncbi:MAG: undecaprenyldiphospho-muramoylpentapeptide beta-N-acetylglucosaminyltransferase [Cetobacterium sp.]|uniref:undecaprenyldiphospho-muramoylpentapeptide beta-N-acetylglucosaminyltransferase n=1 Tax=Cetobacterium sp. TaxID=2071632 RepID=UPI003F3E316A